MNSFKFIIFFTLMMAFSFTQHTSVQDVGEILNRVEETIKTTKLLSFKSECIRNNPNIEDSISRRTATIWLKRVSEDTMFGAYFHLKGKYRLQDIDYFYDGQRSYEIHHFDKKIILFKPFDHPNTPNNPAKARSALAPLNTLLLDENFVETILKNNSKATVQQSSEQKQWIITLDYYENEYGQKVSKTLVIDMDTAHILQIDQVIKWRGSIYISKYLFSDYISDERSISKNISMVDSYKGYAQDEFRRDSSKKVNAGKELIGIDAPHFNFESLFGENISLDQFKGRMVLLDFWESWCGYCILAFPEVKKLQMEWKKDLTVIGVVTENKKQIKKLIANNSLNYPHIFANQKMISDYKVSARPTYVLITQSGKISLISTGDLDDIKTQIKKLAQ